MKLGQFYKLAVKFGKENDPRDKNAIAYEVEKLKNEYKNASDDKQKYLDKEMLDNPYADTKILYGKEDTDIKTILAGIDMEVGELLLADRLREKGKKIDLVLSHHPEGRALAGLNHVMNIQTDILHKFGVPINVAEGLLEDRIKEVEHRLLPGNHNRAVDAAKLLQIPFMCAHTVADNCVTTYLQDSIDKSNPPTVEDIVNLIKQIPEYQYSMENKIHPTVVSGNEKHRAGKVFVDMTGGTEGSEKIFEIFQQIGIGTIVGMHYSQKHLKEAKKYKLNIVIAGHICSDNLGVNLLLDKIEKETGETLDILATSGFKRISRNN